MDEWIDEILPNVFMNLWMHKMSEGINGWTNEQISFQRFCWIYKWTDEWIHGWMSNILDEWVILWMND